MQWVPRDEIWIKIKCMMTDSVSLNFGVKELVSKELRVEHTPEHLLCQVHPSLMFNRETTGLFKDIDTSIGREKIFASFEIPMGEQATSIAETCISCSLRLVSHDFDHKLWNRTGEFVHVYCP